MIVKDRLILDNKINEFCFLLGVVDNKVDNQDLWQHLDQKFNELIKMSVDEVPTDLLALYADVLSKVKSEEEQKEMWDKVDKLVEDAETKRKYKQT